MESLLWLISQSSMFLCGIGEISESVEKVEEGEEGIGVSRRRWHMPFNWSSYSRTCRRASLRVLGFMLPQDTSKIRTHALFFFVPHECSVHSTCEMTWEEAGFMFSSLLKYEGRDAPLNATGKSIRCLILDALRRCKIEYIPRFSRFPLFF